MTSESTFDTDLVDPLGFSIYKEKVAKFKSIIAGLPASASLRLGTAATDPISDILKNNPIPIIAPGAKDNQWEGFCNRLTALLGQNMVDDNGRFLHLKRGKAGLELFYGYFCALEKAKATGIIWDKAAVRISQLLRTLNQYEASLLFHFLHELTNLCSL